MTSATTEPTPEPTPESAAAIRARIEARFAEGWPAYLAVPDAWLPRLGQLDTALAALDPNYGVAQVKTKFGTLRYYLDRPFRLPCCIEWDEANPLPDEADAEDAWNAAANNHADSEEHTAAEEASEKLEAGIEALIDAATRDLIDQDATHGATRP